MKKNNATTATATVNNAKQHSLDTLVKTVTNAPMNYIFKILTAAASDEEADNDELRWTMEAAGVKVFGHPCVTYTDDTRTALVVTIKAKKAKKADTWASIFADVEAVGNASDALSGSTSKACKNSQAVEVVRTAAAALTKNVEAFKAKSQEKADAAAKRAADARKEVVDYLTAHGMTADEAEVKADTTAIIKGKKDAKGRYTFSVKAVLSSFYFTFADAIAAAVATTTADVVGGEEKVENAKQKTA